MQALFGLLYTLLFMSYVFTALFIVYHIAHYSLDKKTAFAALLLFLGVITVLLFTNAILFFTLPWGDLLPQTSSL
ncbi:MAG: hypothetical protein A2808_03680 [Candidatus Moranbacteria bacterium RIFCSPHIGHO2_01_FULL_55_24]|nr:MAG: hypothetical protein A2808_03680 [Candidatus Moranbacteria bacterium RIFCSPHIGHO2_01_FULL_55_24]